MSAPVALLIHSAASMVGRYETALGCRVVRVQSTRSQFSAGYDSTAGIARDCPTVAALLRRHAPDVPSDAPIVLVAYSAGCWLARAVLRDPDSRMRVRAAVFLDGLHSRSSEALGGVLDYARDALEGRRVCVVTHTQIKPPYVSTRETADLILGRLTRGRLTHKDDVHEAGFHMCAYPGADAKAHSLQLQVVGPQLCERYVAPVLRIERTSEHPLVLPEETIYGKPPVASKPAVASSKKTGDVPGVAFTQAKNYTYATRKPGDVLWAVIHTAECGETPTAAENLAAWCAGPQAPKASWHYAIDSDSVTQSVREKDIAWHAKQGNKRGIGFEHAGRAKQQAADWDDAYSQAMIERSAELVADVCKRWDIPIRRATPEDILASRPGICGHSDFTAAYKVQGGHWDPGANFPWDRYLDAVRRHLAAKELL